MFRFEREKLKDEWIIGECWQIDTSNQFFEETFDKQLLPWSYRSFLNFTITIITALVLTIFFLSGNCHEIVMYWLGLLSLSSGTYNLISAIVKYGQYMLVVRVFWRIYLDKCKYTSIYTSYAKLCVIRKELETIKEENRWTNQ